MTRAGRKKPYTREGIKRLKCVRCGDRAYSTFSICADGNVLRPLCKRCDILLNKIALEFMRDPNAESKMRAYRKKVEWMHRTCPNCGYEWDEKREQQ